MAGPRQVVTLVAEWQATAATLRSYGAVAQATVLERCAEQLEARLEEQGATPLTLQEASDLSGYSSDHLGRLVREGKIPNAGRPGAPRIAREDVPIKAGHVAQASRICQIDREQIVRSIINEGV